MLLADEATADALEADLLRYGVDLLDLYRGTVTYRRICTLVAHLPDDAAVWRLFDSAGAWTRSDMLLAVVERRVMALWATVAAALGHDVTDEQMASPLDSWPTTASPGLTVKADPPASTASLREIALWMRSE